MIIKLDFRTKLFMTIVLSYVMVLGNIQTKYFVQAILRTPLCKISSTGEIEQRFRLN